MTVLDVLLAEVDADLVVDEQPDLVGTAAAAFDVDRQCRYVLFRQWSPGPVALLVMLNPSTATAAQDDQTIRRCVGFARREGCGALMVVNLFAVVATDPKVLLGHPAPVGPHNDQVLIAAARLLASCPDGLVIAAWGAGGALAERDQFAVEAFTGAGLDLLCLGVTGDGFPRHPSRLASNTPLQVFRGRRRDPLR